MAEILKRPIFNSPVWPALLSALVAPGVGQFVNRDYKKGAFLLTVTVGAFLWFSKVVMERLALLLPADPAQWLLDQNAFREAVLKLVNENPQMFMTFHLLMIVVWVYGIVDAYVIARHRAKAAPENETDHLAR